MRITETSPHFTFTVRQPTVFDPVPFGTKSRLTPGIIIKVLDSGTVYWITGLAGAGKTTLGRLLFQKIKSTKANVVFLDGDHLREVFGSDLGYSLEDRRKSAERNSRLCKLLSDQGIDVVCATISMIHDIQRWNRQHIPKYFEIFVRVPKEVLETRDQKGLYSQRSGKLNPLAGVDVPAEAPQSPDLILDNDGTRSIDALVGSVLEAIASGHSRMRVA